MYESSICLFDDNADAHCLNGLIPIAWAWYITTIVVTTVFPLAAAAIRLRRGQLTLHHYLLLLAIPLSVASEVLGIHIVRILSQLEDALVAARENPLAALPSLLSAETRVFTVRKFSFVLNLLNITCLWTVKGALQSLVFEHEQLLWHRLRVAAWACMAWLVISLIVCLVTQVLWCGLPVQKSWIFDVTAVANGGNGVVCVPVTSHGYLSVMFAMVLSSDLAIGTLLVVTVWRLREERRGVVVVGLIGSVSVVAAVVRFALLTVELRKIEGRNMGWVYTATIWSEVEKMAAVVAVTLPSLRVLFRSCLEALEVKMSTMGRSSSGSKAAGSSEALELSAECYRV